MHPHRRHAKHLQPKRRAAQRRRKDPAAGIPHQGLSTTSDPETARYASELCGKADRTRISYTVSESSTNANVGWLSGRTSSSKGSVSASKQYQKHKEPLFEEKVFFDLKNAQAVVVAFDGVSPLPPTYCYLKPDFLPVTMSWFDQERIGFDPERIFRVSFEIIIPFLKTDSKHLLLETDTISEIMVNPDGSVWIEEEGTLSLSRNPF